MADREVFVNKVTVPSSSGTITAKLVDSVSGYTKYNYFEIPISYDSANQRYYITGITWQNIIDAYDRGDYIYGKYGNNIYVMTYYIHDAQETFLKLENFTTGQNSITTDGFTVEDLTNLVRHTSDVSGGGGGTVTSVGLANATNGGLSISGSPITSSGSITVGHSNVLSGAQSTQAVYPITIDKNGHVASYGTAVTIPTVTSSYSSTGTDAVNGTAVNAALQTLDSSISATSGQAISAVTITDGKITSSSKINVGETNQNAFSNVKVGSTTIAADSKTDTLELVAGSNITLTPDATNDTITISSTGGGGGGSYTATSPVDITNNVISLEDGYGDIQNPYGAKNEHYVLAGNPSVINYTDSWVSGSLSESLPVEDVTLVAGTYNFSATVNLDAQGVSDDPEIVPPTPVYDAYLGVVVNGDLLYTGESVSGSGTISETLSVDFELSSTTTVDIVLITSSYDYGTVEGNISDKTLTSSIPALPTFRALTTEDLPDGAINAWYGTSFTISTNAVKLVACDGYKLAKGSIIGVLFSASNTAATPTLNVNDTGAKSIYVGNSTPNSTTNVLKWSANTMIYFMYDGTYYRYITSISGASTTPSRGANTWFGTSSTAANTAAKTSTIDNFVLTKGAVVCIAFSTANTYVGGTLTLNINSTGAKNIYYNNAVTSTTNTLLWDAKEMLTFVYSGSYWYFAGKSLQSGGGSGDSTYKITLSHNSSTDEYSIDRTYAEVEAAVRANKYVYIYDYTLTVSSAYQNSTIVAPFTCMCPSEPWFEFYATITDSNSEEVLVRYTLADDGVYVDQYSLARELPYVNTSDNGKVLKVVNGEWSAATSSSGGGLFLVSFSLTSGSSYTADKTFAQIVSAVDSGSVVMGYYGEEYFSLTYFYEGDEQTDGDVRFERYSNNLMSMEWFGMDSQGQVTYGNERPWETYTDNAIGNAMAASY